MRVETDVREAGSSPSWSRIAAVPLLLIATVLAVLVVLGMATGTDRQFDKGVVPLWEIVVVEVVGVASLVTLVSLARAVVNLWRGRPGAIARWTLVAVPLWLFWAMLRVGEYSS